MLGPPRYGRTLYSCTAVPVTAHRRAGRAHVRRRHSCADDYCVLTILEANILKFEVILTVYTVHSNFDSTPRRNWKRNDRKKSDF